MPGGHARKVQVLPTNWAHPLYHQAGLSQTRIPIYVDPRLVGLQGFPQQVGTNPPFHQNCLIVRRSHPLLWAALDPPFLWSCLSCWMERGVIFFYQLRPVHRPEGCFWTGVQTGIFEGDLPLRSHRARGVLQLIGLYLAGGVHLPPGLYWSWGVHPWGGLPPGVSVLGVWLAGIFGDSWNGCGFWYTSCFLTAGDWLIILGSCAPQEMEQFSCSLCPSSITTVTSAQW